MLIATISGIFLTSSFVAAFADNVFTDRNNDNITQFLTENSFPVPLDGAAHYPGTFVILIPGMFIATISGILLTSSFVAAFADNVSTDRNNDNITQFLIENSESIRNGTYDYSDQRYPVISAAIIDPWLERMGSGMKRYNFGKTVDNFCWVITFILRERSFRDNILLHYVGKAKNIALEYVKGGN
ncbi:unnamed protein product [Strongylus vulgaris]|uniref:Uncharacterized protein n=1 Tax=Strongylus vulgaris TaxID=40348 RepID=A0A3P7LD56_STRVU|nr:unnamed protein product [Strongylus vulgaris]